MYTKMSAKEKAMKSKDMMDKAMVSEGDFAIASCHDEVYVGRVEYIMLSGALGLPGSKYYLETTSEMPAVLLRVLEFEEDGQYWEETEYMVGASAMEVTKIEPLVLEVAAEVVEMDGQMSIMMDNKSDQIDKQDPCWDGFVQRGMKPGEGGSMVPNCIPVAKAYELDQQAIFANLGKDYSKASRLSEIFKAKTDYGKIIPARAGEPKNKELYARVVSAAKAKFDVYPSAVANAWVVREYKSRGGKY